MRFHLLSSERALGVTAELNSLTDTRRLGALLYHGRADDWLTPPVLASQAADAAAAD
jgi:hypothetical protein